MACDALSTASPVEGRVTSRGGDSAAKQIEKGDGIPAGNAVQEHESSTEVSSTSVALECGSQPAQPSLRPGVTTRRLPPLPPTPFHPPPSTHPRPASRRPAPQLVVLALEALNVGHRQIVAKRRRHLCGAGFLQHSASLAGVVVLERRHARRQVETGVQPPGLPVCLANHVKLPPSAHAQVYLKVATQLTARTVLTSSTWHYYDGGSVVAAEKYLRWPARNV